ncbi:sodium/solute symporter [Patulibacter defluvii]|uniref:sodium/solute symporter n=1 Tax=Patulibacter defluvii TaxID=3095358 RepID=UPI002A764C30|nr:cation acetate symporter [Patulibacter sp. DM4]
MLAIGAIVAVTAGALGIGAWGVRWARTTSDLFVASRAITPWWNAAAISGEYLSAASFLGIAGLTMRSGLAALWLPVGFTAGYLALLLFVAAPLRRFGSYTIPDFVEGRLGSAGLRLVSAVVLLAIGALYVVPQLRGAGLVLGEVADAPYALGIALAAAVVCGSVAFGGMRAVTYVQAFQYWVKIVAISLPACLLLVHLGGLPERAALLGRELPRAPAAGLTVRLPEARTVTFPRATDYRVVAADRVSRPARARAGERVRLPAGELRLPAGAAVPVAEGIRAQTGHQWARPAGGGGRGSPLFIYSLLVATFLGTMGLPHILVRFYTNATGSAARHTTIRVLGLIGLFYLFPVVYGLLGRVMVPELYVTGDTDLVVLRLPEAVLDGWLGRSATALVAAGAFAAFVSTASGLLVSTAGTVAYDLAPRLRPEPPDGDRVAIRRRRFRTAAVVAIAIPALLAVAARGLDITILVSWSFALAASTFCPLLLLGIWWTRLTPRGALAGMVAGGAVASAGIVAALIGGGANEESLLSQPAVVSVPLAFATMIVVSLRDQPLPRRQVAAAMRALHVPERSG